MEFFAGALLGWLSKKLRSALGWLLRGSIAWLRATPRSRCAFVTVLYTKILERLVRDIKTNKINDPRLINWLKRLDNWVYPRLKNWNHS